jgi:diguanylate cyclase (GGDEF)-like protein
MSQPLAYLNGQLTPASEAAVPVYDAGFVLGSTVTEQLRTFGGQIFCLQDHLSRLAHSLQISGIQPRESIQDLAEIAVRLVAENIGFSDPDDDLGLCIFITPGPYAAMAEGDISGPTVCLHTYRLPFFLWADAYRRGVSLRTTAIKQVPRDRWPAELKCRSRMHYYLADRLAAQAEPGSRALLLDDDGFVCETSTANVVAYCPGEGLISPPHEKVLPGISLHVAEQLAGQLGITWSHRDFSVEQLARAEEVFLTSTPNCILPVTRFNGAAIGKGQPGPTFAKLLSAFSNAVRLDIAAQARRFANRPLALQGNTAADGDDSLDAYHDTLTRLPNRRLFDRRLREATLRARQSEYQFAVLFIDLDRFKEVNDRYGHLIGDSLLAAASERLSKAIRPQDTLARRDGDEFTILLDDLKRADDAVQVARRIAQQLQLPLSMPIKGTAGQTIDFTVTASIGIAIASHSDRALEPQDLIARADAAMYRAKSSGGGTFHVP